MTTSIPLHIVCERKSLRPQKARVRETTELKDTRQWTENQDLSARFPDFLFSGSEAGQCDKVTVQGGGA